MLNKQKDAASKKKTKKRKKKKKETKKKKRKKKKKKKKKSPGTHWACYIDSFYFDPFGLQPPKNILFIKRYNTSQYQKKISVLCGYFCLFFH